MEGRESRCRIGRQNCSTSLGPCRFRNFYAGSRVGLEIPWLLRKPNVLTQFGLFGSGLAPFHADFYLGLLTAMSTFSSPTRGGSEAGANSAEAARRTRNATSFGWSAA